VVEGGGVVAVIAGAVVGELDVVGAAVVLVSVPPLEQAPATSARATRSEAKTRRFVVTRRGCGRRRRCSCQGRLGDSEEPPRLRATPAVSVPFNSAPPSQSPPLPGRALRCNNPAVSDEPSVVNAPSPGMKAESPIGYLPFDVRVNRTVANS
jgi:hypothetical protein